MYKIHKTIVIESNFYKNKDKSMGKFKKLKFSEKIC